MAEISSEIEELRRKFIDHPEQFDAALAEYTRSIQSAVWVELRGGSVRFPIGEIRRAMGSSTSNP